MFENFPLWPARASSISGNVDALYVFLLLLSGFMCVAIFTMILIFALKYRRQAGVEAEQIEGSTILELTWSIIPGLGRLHLLPGAHSPAGRLHRLRGRQTVDVEAAA